MVKVRAVLTGLLLATTVAFAVPAAPALAAPVAVQAVAPGVVVQQNDVDPGPKIDPEQTNKAGQEKTKNKIIVGVLAAVLALLVIWGRSVRKKKRKAAG
ncbi:hypothetical protein HNR02_000934 [Amycolatopsis endophytica]|uniref:Uncharacterized protein n=1 Tax=Amycolatopsis endophytica TaxID=860233 RepID=A0A853AYG3_9PSEU|nr:hypothetical protein [Amycolatopsis endophytica]NYI87611.1 hypothetical protein [Amycolatopsis endophytica]